MNTTTSRKILAVSLMAAGVTIFSLSNSAYAQEHKSCCGDGNDKNAVAMNDQSGDSQKKMDNHKSGASVSIVREGKIDLKAIDKNKDGIVFQDPMDWNVISDVPGKCPLCKMTLKEVTLKEAKKNLLENNYKVK